MSATAPSSRARTGFEPWAWISFALLIATVGLFIYLGLRPGAGAIRAYLLGPPTLGVAAAAVFAVGLPWSLWRRPVLSRRRLWAFGSLVGVVWMASFPLPYPSSHEGHPSAVEFELPVEGEWRVRWGGDRRETNVLVLFPSRRFGFDLVREDGESLGAQVFAPAAGRVARVLDEMPDGSNPAHSPRRHRRADPFGNYLVLEVAEGEYLVLASLAQGSLRVAQGDLIAAGQPVARVGQSAASRVTPGPHLMIHLQDVPVPGWGEGIPMRFLNYIADGAAVASGVPRGGFAAGQVIKKPARAGAETPSTR